MKDEAYYPSWKNVSQYRQYLNYFGQYLRYGDWKSVLASLRMVLLNDPGNREWYTRSAMGRFKIRKGTTDFQFINYAYEHQVRDFLKQQVVARQLDVFIDIGACIGEYDVWLAAQGVHCIAFEPVNHKALEENIQLNKLAGKIRLFPCGLGNTQEKVNFKIMRTVTGSSYVDRENTAEGSIPIERLDDLLPGLDIDLQQQIIVKLDVEGMETAVLEGARNFISSCRHLRIIFERYEDDNTVNNKLSALADFRFERVDRFNYLAIKQQKG
ncbi:FkbM family methyltransferase [Chitinophaga sp. Cy-1792]|uniref:FkbM family methyltransferase n=1 Tax=Chitinophaga sp. Cy-1792 TaxID=2608339 RepID=UPI00142186E0|nr:FkbM family methyltransferase [Chitinophaga sp. Cy-1792]NIG55609.1 FkbM family methyltransferase [Chitinophaga sp. Cy-1792]